MKRQTFRTLTAISCVLVFLLFSSTEILAAKKLKLKLPTGAGANANTPYDFVVVRPLQKWVTEATNGRAEVIPYWGGSLVPLKDFYRATQEGLTDIAMAWSIAEQGALPLSQVFSLPGLFSNMATSTFVLNELFEKYPEFEQQFSPKVKYITSAVVLRSNLHSREPIRTLADLKGKKIACQTDSAAKALNLLGAAAYVMPVMEMYTALERKVADGVVCGWGVVALIRLNEVAPYHTLVGLPPGVVHYVWNRNTWNKFTPEEQQRLDMMAMSFQPTLFKVSGVLAISIYKGIESDEKQEIIEWPNEDLMKMRETFRPMWNEWAERMEKKGYPGKAILKDAEFLINVYNQN